MTVSLAILLGCPALLKPIVCLFKLLTDQEDQKGFEDFSSQAWVLTRMTRISASRATVLCCVAQLAGLGLKPAHCCLLILIFVLSIQQLRKLSVEFCLMLKTQILPNISPNICIFQQPPPLYKDQIWQNIQIVKCA